MSTSGIINMRTDQSTRDAIAAVQKWLHDSGRYTGVPTVGETVRYCINATHKQHVRRVAGTAARKAPKGK